MNGWRPSYVTKLVAQGRLVLTADGKRIEVDASKRRLEETRRVDRQGVREHHARTRGKNGITREAVATDGADAGRAASAPVSSQPGLPMEPATGGSAREDDQAEYNRARAQKEAAQAAMADLELKRRTGELVEIGQVRDMAARIAGIIARGFERIGPRIGPVWSTEQEPAKRERLLEDELRKIQDEFSDEILKLAGASGA